MIDELHDNDLALYAEKKFLRTSRSLVHRQARRNDEPFGHNLDRSILSGCLVFGDLDTTYCFSSANKIPPPASVHRGTLCQRRRLCCVDRALGIGDEWVIAQVLPKWAVRTGPTRPQSVRRDYSVESCNRYVPDEPLPMVRPIRHWPIDRASSRPLLLPEVVDMRLRRSPVLGPAVDWWWCWGGGARLDAVWCDACAMMVVVERVDRRVSAGKGDGELGVAVKGTSNCCGRHAQTSVTLNKTAQPATWSVRATVRLADVYHA